MNIIITIPAYNEEKTLPSVLEEITEVMNTTNYSYRLLVVDDGSTDRTAEVAKKQGAIVVSNPRNVGLAETFRVEMRECLRHKADLIVHTDADGQYPARHIPELIEKVNEGYDLVLGSRFHYQLEHMSWLRRLGNKAFSRVLTSLTKIKITDSTTGFRVFTAAVAAEINYINTFTYTQEQIIKAAKQGFRLAEIPVTTRKTRTSRLFRNPFQYAFRAWTNILRIYRDYEPMLFFGRIGFLGLLAGMLIGLYFVYLHFTVGIKGHPGLLFLMMILLVFGFQTVIFGFLADMLRK